MKYIQSWFRGHLMEAIHIVRGPYAASAAVKASDAANLVETWCGQVFQDRTGLQRGQDTEAWRQGVSSDQPQQAPGVWCNDGGICSSCQEVLRIHTEYPGELAAMDNDALYQEFRDAHRPDDYDGDFTAVGTLQLQMAVAEMVRRLRECGFLSA